MIWLQGQPVQVFINHTKGIVVWLECPGRRAKTILLFKKKKSMNTISNGDRTVKVRQLSASPQVVVFFATCLRPDKSHEVWAFMGHVLVSSLWFPQGRSVRLQLIGDQLRRWVAVSIGRREHYARTIYLSHHAV